MTTPNWKNRTVFVGDNVNVLRGMNSESVDLIYLDPPFKSDKKYERPIGGDKAGFKDTWTLNDVDQAWVDDIRASNPALHAIVQASGVTHSSSMKSYLIMMAVRLLELHRVLKPTGSIYLHCDDVASHYLKLLMDAIFGKTNFKNDIVWRYGGSARGAKALAKHFARNNDNIILYAKDRKQALHHAIRENKAYPSNKPPSHIRRGEDGRYFKTAPRGDYTDDSIDRLRQEGRIYSTKSGSVRIKYHLEVKDGKVLEPFTVGSVWDVPDMMHTSKSERIGYPTQKPLALLTRIIKASSEPGDVVLDPFCGCATSLVAAELNQRQWVGIDLSPLAVQLVKERLQSGDVVGVLGEVYSRKDVPGRTDQGKLPYYTKHKTTLYGECEGYCGGCGAHFEARNLEVDHIVPRKKGGTDHIGNLQLLCGHCNRIKGAGTQAQLKAKLKGLGIL